MGDFEGDPGCGPTHHFACKCREDAFAAIARLTMAWQYKNDQLFLYGVKIPLDLTHGGDLERVTALTKFVERRREIFEILGCSMNVPGVRELLEEDDPTMKLVEQLHRNQADMTMLKDENSRLRSLVGIQEENAEVKRLRDENARLRELLGRKESV